MIKSLKVILWDKEIGRLSWDERKKRNNVKASIFQYCFQTRNNKTRFRGSMTSKCLSRLRKMFQRAL